MRAICEHNGLIAERMAEGLGDPAGDYFIPRASMIDAAMPPVTGSPFHAHIFRTMSAMSIPVTANRITTTNTARNFQAE